MEHKEDQKMKWIMVGVAIGIVAGALLFYGLAVTGLLRPLGIAGFAGGMQGSFAGMREGRNMTWNGTGYPGPGQVPSGP
jgi:hypothetical protein